MRPPKKGSKTAQGSGKEVLDALREIDQQRVKHAKSSRFRRKFRWLGGVPGKVKGLLIGIVVAFLLLVIDGLRREGQEFSARLVEFSGRVTVTRGQPGESVPPSPGLALADRAIVRTGSGATATLAFPDGSSISLEPGTEFEVRLLDYARGGVRDRSFMVRAGAAVANISQFFGAKSRAAVCTPTAVAAVRGTAFRVAYDPRSARTSVLVAEGAVRFRTAVGETQSAAGQAVNASGYALEGAGALPQRSRAALGGQVQQLSSRFERSPGFLANLEMAINNFLDPALQFVGLAPGSWSYSAGSFARKGTCMEALRRLHQHMEANFSEDVPQFVNPVTLRELNLPVKQRDAILDTFSGFMLEGYRRLDGGRFAFRARARDRNHTLFELTNGGVREVRE